MHNEFLQQFETIQLTWALAKLTQRAHKGLLTCFHDFTEEVLVIHTSHFALPIAGRPVDGVASSS